MLSFWEGVLSSGTSIAVVALGWLFTRKRIAARTQVENEATVVKTITDVMDELRTELSRARAIAAEAEAATYQAQAALRRLAAELDQIGRALALHRAWDEAHAKEDAPFPPPLPVIPRWWEIVADTHFNAPDEPI